MEISEDWPLTARGLSTLIWSLNETFFVIDFEDIDFATVFDVPIFHLSPVDSAMVAGHEYSLTLSLTPFVEMFASSSLSLMSS
jgi:hypothetical protein